MASHFAALTWPLPQGGLGLETVAPSAGARDHSSVCPPQLTTELTVFEFLLLVTLDVSELSSSTGKRKQWLVAA